MGERMKKEKGVERGAPVKAAGVGETSLGSAAAELRGQHPHHHSAGGIHHTSDHIRHELHRGK